MAQVLKTDQPLFLTVVLMAAFGMVMVYSSSSVNVSSSQDRQAKLDLATAVNAADTVPQKKDDNPYHPNYHFLFRQMGWAAVSLLVMMCLKRCDYKRFESSTWAFAPLGIVMALLVLVYFLDGSGHRWLRMGGFGIQPAEFARPALIVFLAWFVTRRANKINTPGTWAPAALALGVLAACVIIADIGTAAVLMCTAGAVFYVAGLDKRYFLAAVAACVLMMPVAILSKPYRVHRVIAFLDPDDYWLDKLDSKGVIKNWANQSITTRDAGYHVRQSKIAVATGGVFGLGLNESKQKLRFLPEAHNDFIYAIICEELGLWGATAVLAGYLIILWRGLRLYWLVPDDFGRYLALGVCVAVVSQALMNMSVVLDIAPAKGFTLPLISYGGSSLLSSMTSLGLLLSVSDHAA
ncbi:MAG: FtsW/RodA/SpoVE family cell cycle protein [Acidobacteria bacterium]|nr:FtsW/RodA/SpoVE family cell cycle protein [Acidobacteriota bacterium]